MNGQNLTVYDFVVDVVPGAFTIVLALSLLPAKTVDGINVAEITVGSSVMIVVFGYFIGHVVQAVASPIDNKVYNLHHDNYPFEQALEEAQSDSVEGQFADRVNTFFAPDETDGFRGYETFKLTQSYLWNNDIGRAQRFQVLYTFLRSMWVILIGGAVLHILGLVALQCFDYGLLWTPLQSGVIIVSMAATGCIAYIRRLKYHSMMADALIFDLYANVLAQQD